MFSRRIAARAVRHSAAQARSLAVRRPAPINSVASRHLTSPPRAIPLVQTIAVDRFGRQHRIELQAHADDAFNARQMASLTAALLAGGAVMASAFSEDAQAHAAGDAGSNSPNGEDLIEQLKKKVQAFADENLASLQQALPAHFGDVQQHVNDFLASGKGGQISWGFMMGVCSGFALKKVSKVGAVALGTVFILFQCASYSGYIDVNYKKIERDMMDILDVNKDGKFDTKDVDEVYKAVMKVLEFSLPAGSGFGVGFVVGFRAG
ncbi:hypothetical protein ATCC90586_004893 [Pythium insidiosum]|nr:hypothetical protein ATCC90586_004893 [Pythium insidiosum]